MCLTSSLNGSCGNEMSIQFYEIVDLSKKHLILNLS